MIILGIDFGDARTGVAKLDTRYPIATPLETVRKSDPNAAAEEIRSIAAREKAERLVVGLPRNMNGREGFRAEKTREFGRLLEERTGLPVVYFDERLTSGYAHAVLNMTDTRGNKRKETVDAVAATVILQGYIDAQKGRSEAEIDL